MEAKLRTTLIVPTLLEGANMVRCELCNRLFEQISYAHLYWVHNITTSQYREQFPDAELCSEKFRQRASLTMLGKQNALGYKHTEKSRERMRLARVGRQPFLGYEHSEKCKQSIRLAMVGNQHVLNHHWKVDNETRRRVSDAKRRMWADPNSTYNTEEFLKRISGYGWKGYSSDGHFCQSSWELEFEEWLIASGIKHIPHPSLPNNNGRRADQLINGCYVEIDGMNRNKKYWEKKYGNTDIEPIVIKVSDKGKSIMSKVGEKQRSLICGGIK